MIKVKFRKIDPRRLTGEALYIYLSDRGRKSDYAGVVRLLPMATAWDAGKTYEILERSVREGRKLRAVYPAYDKAPPSSWEYVGGIEDGALYLSPAKGQQRCLLAPSKELAYGMV